MRCFLVFIRCSLLATLLCGCHLLLPYGEGPSSASDGRTDGDAAAADAEDGPAPPAPDGPPSPVDGPPSPVDGPPLCAAGSVLCGTVCVAGTDCRGCAPLLPLLCRARNACVASCSDCVPNTPIECFACNMSQKEPIGSCETAFVGDFCRSGDYSSAYLGGPGEHCDCSDTLVAECPGDHQVCVPKGATDWCVSCGELTVATDGLPCKGGGTCDTSLTPPRCR